MDASTKRYLRGTALSMGAYVALIVVISWFPGLEGAPRWLVIAAALAPGLAITAQLWAVLRYLRESDEYFRALLAKRFIAAALLAFSAATIYGFLESFAAAPHVPMWMVYPMFWAAFGLVSPFLRTTAA
jgi:hypothetical protein